MGPSRIDRGYQLAYRGAYCLMRAYWALLRPTTHGALVALWHEGQLLLIRNSYVSYYSLPGGYVRSHESGREAAVRELAEEVGLRVGPDQLSLVLDQRHEWEHKRERVEIFELDAAVVPRIVVDHREVIDAAFFSPSEALKLDLFPPIRCVLAQRLAGETR